MELEIKDSSESKFEREFEKTKPICWSSNLHNVSSINGLWDFRRLEATRKQSQFKAKQSQLLGIGAREAGTMSIGFGDGAFKSQEPVWCGGILPGKYVKNRRFGLSRLVYIGEVRIVIV